MHKGPVGCVDAYKEFFCGQVVWEGDPCLVHMPHQKGLQLESCFCQQDSLCPESGRFLLYGEKRPHLPHGHAHRTALLVALSVH